VITVTSHSSLNGHLNSFDFRAFLRKNALQLSHVTALKLYPRALSPQTEQSLVLSGVVPPVLGPELVLIPELVPNPLGPVFLDGGDVFSPCVRARMSAIFFQIQDQSRTLVPKGGIFETN